MYRNKKVIWNVPKDPYKCLWLTNSSGIVREDWTNKCETPIVFLDIDGVMNNSDWAEALHRSRTEPESEDNPKYPIWYHEWCDVTSVDALKKFCNAFGFMIVITSSWRKNNIFDTLKELSKIYGFRTLFPYIIGQTNRLNIKKTCGKSWIRGDEIKVWCDGFEPSWYGILDDDNDVLPEQKNHFYQVDPEHGLHENELLAFKCKFNKIHKRAWKEKFDFSFGKKVLTYNYNTKSYE